MGEEGGFTNLIFISILAWVFRTSIIDMISLIVYAQILRLCPILALSHVLGKLTFSSHGIVIKGSWVRIPTGAPESLEHSIVWSLSMRAYILAHTPRYTHKHKC